MQIIERAIESDPPHLKLAFADLAAKVKEIPGPANHASIMAAFRDVGRPDIKAETTAWCAAKTGQWLKNSGFPIPPPNIVLTAASYETYGRAILPKDVRRGDILVFYREGRQSWKRHVGLYIGEDGTHYYVLGGNQSNAVTITRIAKSELAAIRRPVAATIRDLRAAGSNAIKRGDAIEAVGVASGVGVPAVTGVAQVADKLTAAAPPVPAIETVAPLIPEISVVTGPVAVATPVEAPISTTEALRQAAENTGLMHQITDASIAIGNLFVANPWLVGCMGMGFVVWFYGRNGKWRRVAQAAMGMPLASEVSAPAEPAAA